MNGLDVPSCLQRRLFDRLLLAAATKTDLCEQWKSGLNANRMAFTASGTLTNIEELIFCENVGFLSLALSPFMFSFPNNIGFDIVGIL